MHPVFILLIAVTLVLVSILAFRLHAFLALTLAALVVAALTPAAAIELFLLEKGARRIVADSQSVEGEQTLVRLAGPAAEAGTMLKVLYVDQDLRPAQTVERGTLVVASRPSTVAGEMSAELIGGGGGSWSGEELVVTPAALKAARQASNQTIGERVAAAFGSTCGKIGILIALAAIIGKCLLDSGAADRIVRSAMRVVGERGAPLAFVGSGFLLGIPVFFDTVFYLMMPLGKAMRTRTGRNYLLYVLTIVAGATMAHSLVPPTPGPLLVSEELGVDLGLMILAGCGVGLCSSMTAFAYATFVNRRYEVPLRESADLSLKDLEELAHRDESLLPPLWLSVMPIVLPVVFIAGNTILEELELFAADHPIKHLAETLGNKNIALGIATAIAIGMLVRQQKKKLRDLADSIQAALSSGGVIILITAAGGAFGAMLQQTGIASLIRDLPAYSPLAILTLAFFITTGIRTAQGSATVAMITAVGILASFGTDGDLGCHPVYLALAIGCGSKPIAWMNDSGFWVICKMSGMTEAEGLRFVTPMSILMGLAGLTVTLAMAALFPMAG
jgi:GntP family gluconate:H+ symporter